MSETIMNLITFFKENPIFIALAGSLSLGSLITAGFFMFRWMIDKLKFMCVQSLVIEDYHSFFKYFNIWMSEQKDLIISRDFIPFDKKGGGRNADIVGGNKDSEDKHQVKLVPGFGFHFFIYKKRLYFMHRIKIEKTGIDGYNKEKIELVTISFKKNGFIELFDNIMQFIAKEDKIKYYTIRYGSWANTFNKDKRTIESIFMEKEKRESIINDIDTFHKAKDFYKSKYIPYKRNYLFYGAPGCGKSSFINALATKFDLGIYILNFNILNGEEDLIDIATELNFPCILLIEDIDAANIKINRDDDNNSSGKDGKERISMSLLLNMLDGMYSSEERITIITTNCPEKLDPALVRSGRIDFKFEFELLTTSVAIDMICNFYEVKENHPDIEKIKTLDFSISGADLESILMKNKLNDVYVKLKERIENNDTNIG